MQRVSANVSVDMGSSLKTNITTNSKEIESLVALADQIWKSVLDANIPVENAAGCADLLQKLQKEHADFATSFPIPLKWMAEAREYSPKAFKSFLEKHVKPIYKDRKEFMYQQGEYLVLLHKRKNPRAGAAQIAKYREHLKKNFDKDDDDYMAANKEAAEEKERIKKQADLLRRKRILSYLDRTEPLLNEESLRDISPQR